MSKQEHDLVLDVKAKYIGAASFFASQEKESEQLCNVFVLPALGSGAVIWALNGYHAFFAYDADGIVEKPLQIAPHKEFLKACGCKADSVAPVQVQADAELEALRVVSTDRKTGEEARIDFFPSPARELREPIGYDAFLGKYLDSTPGITAKAVSTSTYALMTKIFKDRHYPVIRQAGTNVSGEDGGVIYHTFALLPEILIVAAPVNDPNENSYSNFSNLTMELLASPHAKSNKVSPIDGESFDEQLQEQMSGLYATKGVDVTVTVHQQ